MDLTLLLMPIGWLENKITKIVITEFDLIPSICCYSMLFNLEGGKAEDLVPLQ